MTKRPRTDVIALAALGAAAAVGIAVMISRSSGGGADPLEAVPADAFMVVSVDVVSLAESPLGEALIEGLCGRGRARRHSSASIRSPRRAGSTRSLTCARLWWRCPRERRNERSAETSAWPVSGTLTKDALATCAKAVITKRGDKRDAPAGSFTVVSDGRTPAGAEVAFREGGPDLVGRGAWLARMIDAADGRIPSTLSAARAGHGALRAGISATRDTDAVAVRATALLPQGLRERLEREMAREAEATPGGR